MRTFALACAVALVAACASAPPAYQPVPLRDRVACKVEVDLGFATAQGSCAPITANAYLTAAHVVDAARFAEMGLEMVGVCVDGLKVAEIILLEGLDAAVLVMEAPHGKAPWRLDVRSIAPAEDVAVSGWGLGEHWWSRGLGTLDPRRLSIPIINGDSGGPVLDADGDIVGIMVARNPEAGHHTYIVPITDILAKFPEKMLQDLALAPSVG
jgi:hypothetical protein